MKPNWEAIRQKALSNQVLNSDEAFSILKSTDDEIMDVVEAARAVRQKYFGKAVKLNYLINIKSGICPEDCHYCSQSKLSEAPIAKYPLMAPEDVISHVERGLQVGAKRACLVASGRGPSEKEMNSFCRSVEALLEKHPGLEICACLGLLSNGQAGRLKEAGVYAYNHNINTSEAYYERICQTHTYRDRLDTLEQVKEDGLSPCSGVLAGMGETDEDLVQMAFTLREKGVDSIPINFLVSIDKTPLEGVNRLTPFRCLRILALFRLINPAIEIRIAGGREVHLRSLQPLGLMIANSIFIGDYLTTEGQSAEADLAMIRDLGYTVLGKPDDFLEKALGPAPRNMPLKT